jgi:hypothetical protein
MNSSLYHTDLFVIFTGVFLLSATPATAGFLPLKSISGNAQVAVQFELPGDKVPQTSVGGGVRGQIQFALPGGAAPSTSVGGGTRANVQFSLPGDAAPNTSVGGGARGNIQFALPGGPAPSTSVGGGTRGDVQFSLPGGSAPSTSVGGGTRGDTMPVLTALVPPTQHGRTIAPRPTIYVYLPPLGVQEAFFSLQDEAGTPHYATLLQVPPTGGVMGITLPVDAPALELDKNYLWYFAPIEPGMVLRPDNYAVVGWVKRVNEPLTELELTTSPIERATQYAKAGIWYDTLKILVEAQRADPNNQIFATEWHDLLEQVGLEALASQPLIEPLQFLKFPPDN